MFTEKDYICVCHGCGNFHIVRSAFMSLPTATAFEVENGKKWIVPNHACKECAQEPSVIGRDNRYLGRIRDAYLFGMSLESRAQAEQQFYNIWRAKLEAAR